MKKKEYKRVEIREEETSYIWRRRCDTARRDLRRLNWNPKCEEEKIVCNRKTKA